MNKKILLTISIISILFSGCGKAVTSNIPQQNTQAAEVTTTKSPVAKAKPAATTKSNSTAEKSTENTTPTVLGKTNSTLDYSQYVKKTWVDKKGTSNVSFSISKIVNGKITGRFNSNAPAVPNHYDLGHLTGTINKDTAECQFSDTIGNKGSIKLVFKPNNIIEATVKLTNKSQYIKERPQEGTIQIIPYNIKGIKGFSITKSQSFMVNLDSWGNVKFVSGKLTGGNHIPVVFYLTNKNGDILYDFDAALPYSVDVKAVSFTDVNNDKLKDVIIIVAGSDNSAQVATVYLQKTDGSFTNDPKLDKEIANSGNNKDVKSIKNYLSQKY